MIETEPSAGRSLGRAAWGVLVALINATLILVALCLWLGWKMVSEARGIGNDLAQNLVLLQPLQDPIRELSSEVTGLRADLAGLDGKAEASAAVAALQTRLAAIEARILATTDRADALLADPGLLVDRAVDRTAMQIREGIAACTPLGTMPAS